jgi:hypothetical protein
MALVVASVGLLRLLGYMSGMDAGLDQWLFSAQLAADPAGVPNRMAPNTALNFMLTGTALLSLDTSLRGNRRPPDALASVAVLIALLALTGYAYGVREFSGFASFIPMALHTAVLFMLLGLAILAARPQQGVMAVAASASLGGSMARRPLRFTRSSILPCSACW